MYNNIVTQLLCSSLSVSLYSPLTLKHCVLSPKPFPNFVHNTVIVSDNDNYYIHFFYIFTLMNPSQMVSTNTPLLGFLH